MMKILFLVLATFIFSANVCAQSENGVQAFQRSEDAWKRSEESGLPKPLEQFEKTSGKMAMKNIFEAEQVFCYEVFPAMDEHVGYTLDGFPIKGVCGTSTKEKVDALKTFLFSNQSAVNFERTEDCSVSPRVILRFVRGIDYTDVLLSSPCTALAVFYAGKVDVYNFTPLTAQIDEMIRQMENKHEPFVSPALLNQIPLMGVVQNEQQRNLVNKINEPIRGWEKKVEEELKEKEIQQQKENTGWNKLKNKYGDMGNSAN